MSGLITLIGLLLLVFYGWGAFAFWQAAARERLKLLRVIALWNTVAALGCLIFLVDYGVLGLLGLALAAVTPILWGLGRVGPRLRQYGLSFARIYSLSR